MKKVKSLTKLEQHRPDSVGQAGRIRPADLTILQLALHKKK
jgi:hypothetical protein